MMEQKQKITQKTKSIEINDNQRKEIYSLASSVSKEVREEICPALFQIVSNAERGPLKNELGRVIFHLQKNERLNTIIGLEKLLDASLIVAPEEMFEVLESCEAKELADKIKAAL